MFKDAFADKRIGLVKTATKNYVQRIGDTSELNIKSTFSQARIPWLEIEEEFMDVKNTTDISPIRQT